MMKYGREGHGLPVTRPHLAETHELCAYIVMRVEQLNNKRATTFGPDADVSYS
jgi:hypothetical protein